MALKVFYFDLDHAIKLHEFIVEVSGGSSGYYPERIGAVESVLDHIQNDDYYPSFLDKITHLFYGVNKAHAFIDGNKRMAIALATYFLEINGYDYCIKDFIYRMENIVIWVADNTVDKELLKMIIDDVIMMSNSEKVKLALIDALAKNRGNYGQ